MTTTGGRGGYAQRAVVARDLLVEIPDELETADAVALLADGRTALMLFEAATSQAGETVLVEAAGGRRRQPARPARRRRRRARRRGRGRRAQVQARAQPRRRSRAVDYSRPGWPRDAGPVDVVFDGVGGAIGRRGLRARPHRRALLELRHGERRVRRHRAGGRRRLRRHAAARQRPRAAAAARAERAGAARRGRGHLKPVVGQWFALANAAAAHAAIEARATIGKTLLVA